MSDDARQHEIRFWEGIVMDYTGKGCPVPRWMLERLAALRAPTHRNAPFAVPPSTPEEPT